MNTNATMEHMPMTHLRTGSVALLAAALALSTVGCGDPSGVIMEFDYPPAAEVRADVFTGDFVDLPGGALDATYRGRGQLNLSDIRDGQLLSDIPAGVEGDAPTFARTEPGVFKVRAIVESADGSDYQVGSVRLRYLFSSGELELDRPLSLLVRGSESRAMADIEFVSGLGELSELQRAFATEAATLGVSLITVPVEVSFLESGGDETFSNVYTYGVTICDGCAEFSTQTYSVGLVDAD